MSGRAPFIFVTLCQRVARAVLTISAAGLLAPPTSAQGPSVALQGLLGAKALLVVDGAPPKAVAPGETHRGVRVLSTGADQAVVEFGGARHTLRIGEAPGHVGGGESTTAGRRIVLTADGGGHYMTNGAINGRAAHFMVDTGATAVSIGQMEAERMGLSYRQGRPVRMQTANGVTVGWVIQLDTVRIGDVTVHQVEAVVSPQPMPFVLLGNSFLSRFSMRRDSQTLVLERRF